MLFFMNIWWFHFIVWLIIRIIIGKSCGVEDTREIPKESKKNLGIPGKEANGHVLKNGELHVSAANHGKTTPCTRGYVQFTVYLNLCSSNASMNTNN